MTENPFRAIIIGGGPTGLVLAHTLTKAGIDFVVLERARTIIPENGAGIVLYAHNQRVFDQLGILDAIREVSMEITSNKVITKNGYHYDTHDPTEWTIKNHGVGYLWADRPQLLGAVYDNLPDSAKKKFLPGKNVENIEVAAEGVQVACSDGTIETGSVIIGADGLNSRVRQHMRELSLKEPGIVTNDEKSFTATYRCLFGNTRKTIPELGYRQQWDMRSKGVCSQVFGGEDRSWFLFYQKLPETTRDPKKYTKEEEEQFVNEFGDYFVTPDTRLKDIYKGSHWCRLSDLHEGYVKQFSHGRMVLVGDAITKQVPNHGLGWNCGIQDAVVLTNKLRALLERNKRPGMAEIEVVFKAYQMEREKPLIRSVEMGSFVIKTSTWDNTLDWLFDRHILRWIRITYFLYRLKIAPLISEGQLLDFLPVGKRYVGCVPWVYEGTETRIKGYSDCSS
ncbi:hypothetical protein QBC44DRAFT_327738 [Cladorrhinum sp. PSN332]|nr:hypothetical protein QBC44DRAFT_327738 [Cladorrhinum sp. PSN332]